MNNIEQYYDANVLTEWTRLDRHPLEYEITKRYLDMFISPGSIVLDAGGGPGKYAFYLQAKGNHVHLFDLSRENIRFARVKAQELQIELDSYRQGNVLDLACFQDDAFDVVLCMGPMYHILDPGDRTRAIRECLRVLRPHGTLFVTFVNRFAQAVSIVNRAPETIGAWKSIMQEVIETGVNDRDPNFTASFFFDPQDIEPFMSRFPVEKLALAGVEGLFAQSEERLKQLDREIMDQWIEFSFAYSTHPSFVGSCQHILYVGRKIKDADTSR